jgi:hypothetical protein
VPFEADIFISYAHLDDEPLTPGQQGWISNFHRALELRVAQIRGEKPRIWRDPELQGNTVFPSELVVRVRNSALLVSVVSPRYCKSTWCSREANEFWQGATQGLGPVLGNQARLFKVVKLPVELADLPSPMQSLLGYDFYKLSPEGDPMELDETWGPEARYEFWVKLNELAYDIDALLDRLEKLPEPSATDSRLVPSPARPLVYVAETTSDAAQDRDSIRNDLKRHGYSVLPDRALPLVGGELETFLRDQVSRCRVSVHILGSRYGIIPEGGRESVPELQDKIARECAAAGKLARLLWMRPNLQLTDQRQQDFVKRARTDPGLNEEADFLETPIEQLKTVLFERLKRLETPAAPPPPPLSRPAKPVVYLVCDPAEVEDVLPLRRQMQARNCVVRLPVTEGFPEELKEEHLANLRACSALLVYWGRGTEAWQNRVLREASEAATQRPAPFQAIAVCIGPPDTQAKRLFDDSEALAIHLPDGPKPEALAPFLAAVEQAR